MKALLVVDVQKDFTEGGALGCNGGKQVAKDVADLIDIHHFDMVVSSQDWHDAYGDNGGRFSDFPDFKNTWVPHCMAGTEGAEYEHPLRAKDFDFRIQKGQGKPAYSAFEGTEASSGKSLVEVLDGVTEVVVVGIALDYCVKATALDSVAAGFNTVVAVDYTACVHGESMDAVVAELEAAGVRVHVGDWVGEES